VKCRRAPHRFGDWADSPKAVTELAIEKARQTPEDINDSPVSAPSKRIAIDAVLAEDISWATGSC
jgi:hypothetical protein